MRSARAIVTSSRAARSHVHAIRRPLVEPTVCSSPPPRECNTNRRRTDVTAPEGLEGKIALVTGASAGIGLAVAHRLAAEGAEVYITAGAPALQKAAAEIGARAHPLSGTSPACDLDRLYDTIGTEKGRLDIVVANAGTIELADGVDATPEHFDLLFDTNARGTYFTVQKALPLMAPAEPSS